MRIEITMPVSLKADTVKKAIEGNIKANSNYMCKVSFMYLEEGENVYEVEADTPSAFYLIGMTASELIRRVS